VPDVTQRDEQRPVLDRPSGQSRRQYLQQVARQFSNVLAVIQLELCRDQLRASASRDLVPHQVGVRACVSIGEHAESQQRVGAHGLIVDEVGPPGDRR
jgi:hypothetical protein